MIVEESIQHEGSKKKVDTVSTTPWNNSRMMISHSVRAATREILNLSQALDVVKVKHHRIAINRKNNTCLDIGSSMP